MPATEETLARTLLELCAVRSEYGNERALADDMERRLRATALEPSVVRIGNSVVAGRARAGGRAVALFGHLDTVPDPGNAWPPRRDDDLIFGLGASDMKSGLAVMLALADDARSDTSVVLVFYDREEGPYETNGLEPVLDACPWLRDTGLGFCLEPTDLELQLGCVGSLHATVSFAGRAAHSARPWQGENAIHKAGPFLAELLALAPREVAFGPGLVFREVTSATLAKGGIGRNVVPASLDLHVNVRFAPGRTPEDAERELRARVGDRGTVTVTDRSVAGPVPRENALLRLFETTSRAVVAPKQAWTDVARLGARGIDAVNFGPGFTSQAHQKDERASVAFMARAYGTLEAFLAAL